MAGDERAVRVVVGLGVGVAAGHDDDPGHVAVRSARRGSPARARPPGSPCRSRWCSRPRRGGPRSPGRTPGRSGCRAPGPRSPRHPWTPAADAGSLVAELLDDPVDLVAGRLVDPGPVVDDAADRRLAHARPAGHVAQADPHVRTVHSATSCEIPGSPFSNFFQFPASSLLVVGVTTSRSQAEELVTTRGVPVRRKLLALSACVTLVAAACGGDDDDDAVRTPRPAPRLRPGTPPRRRDPPHRRDRLHRPGSAVATTAAPAGRPPAAAPCRAGATPTSCCGSTRPGPRP